MSPEAGRVEHDRDQAESEFTPLLRRAWARAPEVLAVAFVDQEGECIDYCSALEPFDAKVAAAHMTVVMAEVERGIGALGGGRTRQLVVQASERDLLVRRVSDEHAVVAVTVSGGAGVRAVLDGLEELVSALRHEGRIERPHWDRLRRALHVQLRAAVGWPYAPLAIVERGRRVPVTEVLGRWTEGSPGAADAVECFRVRTGDGEELTLVHDPIEDAWLRRL